MKYILIIIFSLLLQSTSYSQLIDTTVKHSPATLHTTYLKKAKGFRTAGFVMLGMGLGMAAGSYLSYSNNGFNGVWEGETIFLMGGAFAIGSIPMFILAGSNKRKAKLVLQGQPISYFGKTTTCTAVAIKVTL